MTLLAQEAVGDLLERLEQAARSEHGVARLAVERAARATEAADVSTGFAARTEEGELFVEFTGRGPGGRSLRIRLREGETLLFVPGSGAAEVRDPAKRENFHPLEIWRRGAGRWLRHAFEVSPVTDPDLPASVAGVDGGSVQPLAAHPRRRSPPVYAVDEPLASERRRLRLVPRDAGLAEAIRSIRLHVGDRFLVERMEVETSLEVVAFTMDAFDPTREFDAAAFHPDLSTLRVERR